MIHITSYYCRPCCLTVHAWWLYFPAWWWDESTILSRFQEPNNRDQRSLMEQQLSIWTTCETNLLFNTQKKASNLSDLLSALSNSTRWLAEGMLPALLRLAIRLPSNTFSQAQQGPRWCPACPSCSALLSGDAVHWVGMVQPCWWSQQQHQNVQPGAILNWSRGKSQLWSSNILQHSTLISPKLAPKHFEQRDLQLVAADLQFIGNCLWNMLRVAWHDVQWS